MGLGTGTGLSPRDMLVAIPCTTGDVGRAGMSLGWLGPRSRSLCVPPQQTRVSKLGGQVPTSIPVAGDHTMVHQQLALSSASPSLKHPLLGPGQGDTLVPPKPPPGRGADRSPVPGSSPAACTPSRSRVGSREPAPGPEARFIQPGNIIKLKLIKHLEKGLH